MHPKYNQVACSDNLDRIHRCDKLGISDKTSIQYLIVTKCEIMNDTFDLSISSTQFVILLKNI